jgi:AcrR family transcriptional regulator
MQERSARTRELVLDAAARLFAARGYRSTSMTAIGSLAGVTTGAVYFHFAAKPDIAYAIIELQHSVSSRRADGIISQGFSAVDTLTHLSASLGRDIVLDPIVRAGTALTTETALFPEPNRTPWEDWYQTLISLLTRGREEGDVAPEADVEALAHLIGPAFSGIRITSEILTGHRDLMQRLRELSESLIPAFAADGRRERLIADARAVFAIYEAQVEEMERAS